MQGPEELCDLIDLRFEHPDRNDAGLPPPHFSFFEQDQGWKSLYPKLLGKGRTIQQRNRPALAFHLQ